MRTRPNEAQVSSAHRRISRLVRPFWKCNWNPVKKCNSLVNSSCTGELHVSSPEVQLSSANATPKWKGRRLRVFRDTPPWEQRQCGQLLCRGLGNLETLKELNPQQRVAPTSHVTCTTLRRGSRGSAAAENRERGRCVLPSHAAPPAMTYHGSRIGSEFCALKQRIVVDQPRGAKRNENRRGRRGHKISDHTCPWSVVCGEETRRSSGPTELMTIAMWQRVCTML